MATYSIEAVISRPIGEVFGYLSDLRNELEWNPSARRIRKLTEGPVRLGTRYGAEWRNAPRTEVVITDYRRPTRWQTQSRSWGMDVVFTGELRAEGDRTRYVATLDVSARGPARLLVPLAAGAMRRQDQAHMERIACLLNRVSSGRKSLAGASSLEREEGRQ